ncbi:hypothetical protein Fmac_024846 [Flemingia macrophylla]|uniref:Uncharacterized protein n=1 Tax=Flemingia macrophylla TaxID=520843 RepID=A0ABD1LR60_9FABA
MSVLRLMLQTSIAGHHRSRSQTLDREDGFQLLAVSVQELMHLSFANLVTQLAVNQKPTSVARVCGIRSSNEYNQIARNDGIVIRGANDVATDTSAETRKVEGKLDPLVNLHPEAYALQTSIAGVHDVATYTSVETRKVEAKLDALVNLVAQLTMNQKIPLLQLSVASVRPMKTIQIFSATNDAIVIRGVHDVAIDTSAETRKVEGKQDALVNLVTQQAVNQNPTYVARVYGIHSSNDHHTNRRWLPTPSSFDARNDPIVIRGVHDVAIDTSAENRKVDGKLDALVILVTQLTVNQKSASVARVCGIRSSNDHHTNVCPSFYGSRNDAIVIRGVHDVATNTSAETRKVEGKLDALMNLVTKLAVNQKPASVAIVCGIRSSNDHQQRSVLLLHDVATDTFAETRKVEGKLYALMNMVTQLALNQKHVSVARVYGIRHHSSRDQTLDKEDGFQLLAVSVQEMMPLSLEELTTWLQIHLLKLERWKQPVVNEYLEDYAANIYSRPPQQQRPDTFHDVATNTSVGTRNLEGELDALVNLVTQLAVNQKPASVARVCGIRSSNEHHTNNVFTGTSAETRKVEGKLYALVNLVTQLAVNQKPASVARVMWHPFSVRNDAIVIRGVHDVATDTFAETRKVEGKQDALVNLVTRLAVNKNPPFVAIVCGIRSSNDHHTNRRWLPTPSTSGARNDAIVVRGVHNGATDTSAETRKVEGKLDALVNLVTQLAVNQKSASVARDCGISSSNDHHTNRIWHPTPSSFGARNDAIVIRGVHDVATDTSTESRKVEGKLDALVNLVTQLAVNQKPASVARVCGIRSSNDRHHSSRGQTFDREDGFQLLVVSFQEMIPLSLEEFTTWLQIHLLKLESFSARNDVIAIRGVHDLVTDTSAETRKVEGKLYALVNMVTQLVVNQKPASIARTTTAVEARHLIEKMASNSYSARNDVIAIRGVHDLVTDTSAETRKVESKLYALVNLVTQLAVNQKPASIARVCGIRSSNDHHTNISDHHSCRGQKIDRGDGFQLLAVSVQEMISLSLEEFTTWLQIHLLKLERWKASSCELGDSTRCKSEVCLCYKSLWHPFGARNDPFVIRGVHDVATDASAETRKVDGKLDALENLVTQLAVNQKYASITRVCGIRSSNDHHTNVCPSSLQPGVNEHPEAYAENIYSRPPQQQRVHDVATDTFAENRKVEGKLDTLINLVTQLAVNQKYASVARVCGIHSSIDHRTNATTAAEARHLIEKMASNSYHFSARNYVIVVRGVHDMATDTSAETRKVEGKLDALVNLQPGVNQHPEAYAAKIYSRPPQQQRPDT